MNTNAADNPRPIVSDIDHETLVKISESAMRRDPFVAEALADELDRAEVVSSEDLPSNVVRMGSVVDFTVDGQSRRATLVFPVDADFENGKLSILTPIGAAIIGLSERQTVASKARDGKVQRLTINTVENTHSVQ